jgi:hypothetical protein
MNSRQLLTNGYFNKADLSDMHNMLLMASLACNDVYPWSKQYNMHLLDVADGLDAEQVGVLAAVASTLSGTATI